MRLYPNQIKAHLKQTLQPIYLLSAEEPLLAQECRDALIATAKQQGFADRELLHVESGFNWEHFYESTANLSLFGDRKIIDLRFPSPKVDAKAGKALLEFCEDPNPDTLLIISLPKLESAAQRSKWFKALDKQGTWIPIKPLAGRFFIDWIEQRCRQQQLKCNHAVIKMIADRVEGNLLAAAQEIDKLQLLFAHHDGPITEQHIQTAVANSARYDIFKWIDTLLAGDTTKALVMLNGLKAEGSEPILMLWAFSRELRLITQLSELQQRGIPLNQAMQQHKVWSSRQALISRAVQRMAPKALYTLLQQAHQADLAIKGIRQESVWQLLNEMVIAFCLPRQNPFATSHASTASRT